MNNITERVLAGSFAGWIVVLFMQRCFLKKSPSLGAPRVIERHNWWQNDH